jgi:hypothetical protein
MISEKQGGPKMSKFAACDLMNFGVMEYWRLRLTERYLRWLGTGAVSAHESTKADWKKQARPKGVRPAIANNRLDAALYFKQYNI